MPLYEYECDACGHRFEVIQKMTDPPVEKCPKCGGTVHKLHSAPAFQFKGSGWYVTDYAKKDSAKTAKADGASGEPKKDATEKKEKPAADKAEKKEKSTTSTDTSPTK
jgi:putative FmdB family regulatory protein